MNWILLTRTDAAQLRGCGAAAAPAMRERVLEIMPEAVPNLIRPLLERGLISGWRDVVSVFPAMGPFPKTRKD